ncbi:MAG TPA: flagellar hook-associated protein FlgL [Paraburkholderia sp.]|jgi:flagellar hook-associated protein 3 FlgL
MRISTSMLFNSSVQTMDNQQSQLLGLEDEISSGQAFSTPADDPVGAAQAVQLSATYATLNQYSTNQNSALTSLKTEDTTLGSVTSVLQSIEQLMQKAAGGTLNSSNLSAVAQQMSSDRDELLTLANTTDGSGNSIFAGFQSTSEVFSNAPGGGVTYNGDQGQRLVQVSTTSTVAVGDSGASVFMSVPSVGTDPVPAGSAINTGTGTISPVTVTNSTVSTNSDTYSIVFGTDPTTGDSTYTVTDTTTGTALATDAAYTSGSAIDLGNGMNVTISGTPVSGDTFSVSPPNASANSDLFATIDSVIAALQTPTSGDASASANLSNALTTGMTQLSNSLTNVTTVQASVGGREQEIEALQSVTSSNQLQTETTLSNLTSTDMTAAISEYEEVEDALTASQKSFASTENLSLFQYINP